MLSVLVLAAVLIFGSSCHTSKKGKKMSYSWMLFKELKKKLPDAKVMKMGDTVKVIYPELAMFDFGKDQIKSGALPSFKSFADVLKNYDRINFTINGYTDNVGGADANISLSQRRAESTRSLMISNGIANGRMTTNGMGERNPVMDNTSADGRQANRRVEFILYEKK